MALEKTETRRHEVEENGVVTLVTKTVVTDDGVVVGQSGNHRNPILPGDDYSGEADDTKAICAAVQTEAVVAAYAEANTPAEESSEE
jgi:predicted aconitase